MKLEIFTQILLLFLLPFCKSFSVSNPDSSNHNQYGTDVVEHLTEFEGSGGSGDHSGDEPSSTPIKPTVTTTTALTTTIDETTTSQSAFVCYDDGDCNAPFGRCVLHNNETSSRGSSCECMSTFSGTYCNNSLVFVVVIVVSFVAFTLLITLVYFCCDCQDNNSSRTSSTSISDHFSLKSFDSLDAHLKGVSFLPGMREKTKSVRLVKMDISNEGYAVSSDM